jgi:hypothetical protein
MKNITDKLSLMFIAMGMTTGLHAQTLSNLGATASTSRANDIYQLSTQGNQINPDGLNYFTDIQTGHGSGEPGQTFTTDAIAGGYVLTSVALRTGGIGTSSGTPPPRNLVICTFIQSQVPPPRCCKPTLPATWRSTTAN